MEKRSSNATAWPPGGGSRSEVVARRSKVDRAEALAELGRGIRGRVFLAVQSSLGDRPVVLKVTRRSGGEHLSMARLQHPHVMPLYAVHDFPGLDLRALCMPYLGGATLARVFEMMG